MVKKKIVLELKDVHKIYKMGEVEVKALRGVSLKIYKGDFASIMGPSGSGKSTLMHIIGALDLPTNGEVYIDKTNINNYTENQLAGIRGKKIGFVFQEFNLIQTLTALENVRLPMLFQEVEDRKCHCEDILKSVGLGERLDHKPTELSGGQQQRVAIARSLANNPDIILADEPSGALDSKSSKEILKLLYTLNKKGKTIIIITHDKNIAEKTKRQIKIKDGLIVEDKNVKIK